MERFINKYQSYYLLPCPICNGAAEFLCMNHTMENFTNKPTIRCTECGCELTDDSTLSLISKWNKREPLKVPIIDGDIFDSNTDIIAHQCNAKHQMNSGIARQVREKYPFAYKCYMQLPELHLGQNVIVEVTNDKTICNMIAQEDYGYDGKHYTNITALETCLERLKSYAEEHNYSIALPYKVGCCRGGADWDNVVYPFIQQLFKDSNIRVEIWRLDKG